MVKPVYPLQLRCGGINTVNSLQNDEEYHLCEVNTEVLQMMNVTTARKTNWDVNKFKDWSKEQNEHRDSHEILSAELDLYV